MVKSLRFADGVEVPVPGFGAMGISFALGNKLSYDEADIRKHNCRNEIFRLGPLSSDFVTVAHLLHPNAVLLPSKTAKSPTRPRIFEHI